LEAAAAAAVDGGPGGRPGKRLNYAKSSSSYESVFMKTFSFNYNNKNKLYLFRYMKAFSYFNYTFLGILYNTIKKKKKKYFPLYYIILCGLSQYFFDLMKAFSFSQLFLDLVGV